MPTVIFNSPSPSKSEVWRQIPTSFRTWLPPPLRVELQGLGRAVGSVEELRLRCGRRASLTAERKNYGLKFIMDRRAMDELVRQICGNSLYAHRDSIAQGYVTLAGGVRIGLCGRASVENGRILGVYDVDALNIRFPGRPIDAGAPICRLLRGLTDGKGVLVYAPPGEGKTTLLRSVMAKMASGDGALRISVVDTRGELGCFSEDAALSVDLLTGYPRALGIEIATRTMNSQLLICDEIGEREEAEAILSVQNCGIPLLASAHGSSVEGLLCRDGLRRLHQAHVFGAYVGIRRLPERRDFSYQITSWEEADGMFQNSRLFAGGA